MKRISLNMQKNDERINIVIMYAIETVSKSV